MTQEVKNWSRRMKRKAATDAAFLFIDFSPLIETINEEIRDYRNQGTKRTERWATPNKLIRFVP